MQHELGFVEETRTGQGQPYRTALLRGGIDAAPFGELRCEGRRGGRENGRLGRHAVVETPRLERGRTVVREKRRVEQSPGGGGSRAGPADERYQILLRARELRRIAFAAKRQPGPADRLQGGVGIEEGAAITLPFLRRDPLRVLRGLPRRPEVVAQLHLHPRALDPRGGGLLAVVVDPGQVPLGRGGLVIDAPLEVREVNGRSVALLRIRILRHRETVELPRRREIAPGDCLFGGVVSVVRGDGGGRE